MLNIPKTHSNNLSNVQLLPSMYQHDTDTCVNKNTRKTQSINVSNISIIKTQSTNVSNLSIRRHSQPMCQIYLPKDTVNQCVKFTYQKTQSTNVSNLPIKRHSQPMCQIIYQKTESTNVSIRSRKSKDRLHNDQKIKDKRTNNDLQNIHIKLKIE